MGQQSTAILNPVSGNLNQSGEFIAVAVRSSVCSLVTDSIPPPRSDLAELDPPGGKPGREVLHLTHRSVSTIASRLSTCIHKNRSPSDQFPPSWRSSAGLLLKCRFAQAAKSRAIYARRAALVAIPSEIRSRCSLSPPNSGFLQCIHNI